MNGIQPMYFDPPMTFSVTRDELIEICKESRESHFSFLLERRRDCWNPC